MSLSAAAFIEKNKLATDKAWLILFEVVTPVGTIIRVCPNTEDVTWPVTAGDVYTAFPVEIEDIDDTSDNEVPSLELRVSNVTRALEGYLETEEGLVDSTVTIRIVNSIHVTTASKGAGTNNINPEIELEYLIVDSNADLSWVYFELGASNPWNRRFPRNKIHKNFCRYRYFKGTRCQYAGAQTECDRTLFTCRTVMLNSINFGGAPGVAMKGDYV